MLLSAEGIPAESLLLLEPLRTLDFGVTARSYIPAVIREQRLVNLPGFADLQDELVGRRYDGDVDRLGFLTVEGIRRTYRGTQAQSENHRRLTPFLREAFYFDDTRKTLLDGVDRSAQRDTEQAIAEARQNGNQLYTDVGILGSGPHGVSVAMYLLEQFPNLSVTMVDVNNQLGGIWRAAGPRPAWKMNSRVRAANRQLPPIPRTPGSINPLGIFATMELSDVVATNYAYNTQLGGLTAVNGRISVNRALIGAFVPLIIDRGTSASMPLLFKGEPNEINLNAAVMIDACGIEQQSTLNPTAAQVASPQYFNVAQIYRHYGNAEGKSSYRPAEEFAGKVVIGAGGADSLFTAFEALLGNLPEETYGPGGGVALNRPSQIVWVGAPGLTKAEIEKCLRSRYKDGIVQALPKSTGDQGASIAPILQRARGFRLVPGGVEVFLDDGSTLQGDYLFDCTNNRRSPRPYGPLIFADRPTNANTAVVRVGPGARLDLPDETKRIIAQLGIGENTSSLWALMEKTNQLAFSAGQIAVANRVLV